VDALSLDGEDFYKHVNCPQYLQAANAILQGLSEDLALLKSVSLPFSSPFPSSFSFSSFPSLTR
jgi:hypothetical protein